MAKEKGLTYVKLDGNIGILGNGAGLCMSTLDVVAQAGGEPANFLDAGGGSKADAIVDALEVITSDEKVNGDPLQHLRRHHPLRRGRQGDHRGLRSRSTSTCRWSSASTAPTPRRACALLAEAGLAEPRRTRRRCSAPPSASSSWPRRAADEHHRRRGHEARRLRADRPRGHLPRAAQPRLRHRPRRRRHPRQGRPGRRRRAGLRHDRRGRRRARRQHLDDLRAGPLRRRRRSTRRSTSGDRDGDRDHRGHPGPRHAARPTGRPRRRASG